MNRFQPTPEQIEAAKTDPRRHWTHAPESFAAMQNELDAQPEAQDRQSRFYGISGERVAGLDNDTARLFLRARNRTEDNDPQRLRLIEAECERIDAAINALYARRAVITGAILHPINRAGQEDREQLAAEHNANTQ